MKNVDLLNLFKDGTQARKIVYFIIAYGSVMNYEMAAECILSYTRRISDIREVLLPHGYTVIAERVGNTNSYKYFIRKVGL